jgi:hypothetical protein
MNIEMANSDLNENSYSREKQVVPKTFSRHRRQAESEIRRALHRFATARWPRKRGYGLSDTHTHVQQQPDYTAWRVEHDIPPYDLYRCEAYFVILRMDPKNDAEIVIQSSRSEVHLPLREIDRLDALLAQAGKEPAFIVPRAKGEALDP